jgi:hypothetical protein
MTRAALAQHLQGPRNDRTGTYLGPRRDGNGIRVKRDKHKQAEAYHPKFWRVDKANARPR